MHDFLVVHAVPPNRSACAFAPGLSRFAPDVNSLRRFALYYGACRTGLWGTIVPAPRLRSFWWAVTMMVSKPPGLNELRRLMRRPTPWRRAEAAHAYAEQVREAAELDARWGYLDRDDDED